MVKPLIVAIALSCTALPAVAQTTAHPATPQSSVHHSEVAPADEYFGRLKMSVLGIANVIKDMRLRVEADPAKTDTIFGPLSLVEDAIHDWEQKYPHDSWIPRNLLGLEVAYLHARGDRAHLMAVRAEGWLRRDYPKSSYASLGSAELAKATAPVVEAVDAAPAMPAAPTASQP